MGRAKARGLSGTSVPFKGREATSKRPVHQVGRVWGNNGAAYFVCTGCCKAAYRPVN